MSPLLYCSGNRRLMGNAYSSSCIFPINNTAICPLQIRWKSSWKIISDDDFSLWVSYSIHHWFLRIFPPGHFLKCLLSFLSYNCLSRLVLSYPSLEVVPWPDNWVLCLSLASTHLTCAKLHAPPNHFPIWLSEKINLPLPFLCLEMFQSASLPTGWRLVPLALALAALQPHSLP